MNNPKAPGEFLLLILASGVFCFGSLEPAQAATIDFDHFFSITDNDLANNFVVSGTYQQVASGGITGGGVSSQPSNGGGATYNVSQSQPTTLSISFRYENVDGVPPSNGGASARLGWLGNAQSLQDVSGSPYFYAEFANDGGFSVQNFPTGGVIPNVPPVTVGMISAPSFDTWLKFDLQTTSVGNSDYSLTLTLSNLGPAGQSAPSVLFSGSTTINNSLASADTSFYGGFAGYYHAPLYDNFQVIPEPATIGLLAISAPFCLRRCLTKRR